MWINSSFLFSLVFSHLQQFLLISACTYLNSPAADHTNPNQLMAPTPTKALQLKVQRQEVELVRPSKPTPHELKPLSDIDDQAGLRFHMPVIQFYNYQPSMSGKDPAAVIRRALADALVLYYPLAGRMREGPNRKLMVDCTSEGALFIEADADVRLTDFGQVIHPPFPCTEDLLFDVPGSSAILHAPLLLIQVTRLQCGGFILALRLHHGMSDGIGLVQFMYALGELACGATTPSVLPIWERHILNARSPPRVTCTHHEYEKQMTESDAISSNIPNPVLDDIEHRSFFFGPVEISALRSHLPPHLRASYSKIDLINACIWKCRTIALGHHSDEEMFFLLVVNARFRLDPPLLPKGYYGNAVAYPTAVATAGDLCRNPLGYAVDLMKKAKSKVTPEYMRSVADFNVLTGRRCKFRTVRSYELPDLTRAGFDEVDFGWGKATYGGPMKGCDANSSKLLSSFDDQGVKGILLPMAFPKHAMERFDKELKRMFKNPDGDITGNVTKKSSLILSDL
ncbi:Benzyl alcohol O-benzoyltransferase [Linum grandiflorum]